MSAVRVEGRLMRSKLALGLRLVGVLGLLFFVTAAPGFGGHVTASEKMDKTPQ